MTDPVNRGEVDERGVPMTGRVAGPRGRVFPYGYGTSDESQAPVCGLHGPDQVEMLLNTKEDVWTCPACHPAEVRGALPAARDDVRHAEVPGSATEGNTAPGDGPARDPAATPLGGSAAGDP
jgi:hypothetical protein